MLHKGSLKSSTCALRRSKVPAEASLKRCKHANKVSTSPAAIGNTYMYNVYVWLVGCACLPYCRDLGTLAGGRHMFPHCRSLSHFRCLGGDNRKITHACYYNDVCANTRANNESQYACDNDRDDDDDDDGDDDDDALLFFVFVVSTN